MVNADISIEVAATLFVTIREFIMVVAIGVAISSLDDLLVDLIYIARFCWRRLFVYTRHPRARAVDLRRAEPGWIAIIVPAWDESAVIGDMLRHSLATLDYPRYRIFVGTYLNDQATISEVQAIADDRIACVTVGWNGPTTKADCLNALWRAAVVHERSAGIRFKALVLHDAEDVVDRNELNVFDHLIPKLAMVQLPVMPLPDRNAPWVAGHYMDEFAEAHTKDIIVREAIGAAVPSAGVACAIERTMLGRISALAGHLPFDATCLTEDYELGLKIRSLGGRGALVRIRSEAGTAAVATREHFPGTLDSAIRQKSRWLLGIALQGWDRLGWPGGLADRWMLIRDRKAVVTALLTLFAYFALLLAVLFAAARAVYPPIQDFPALVPSDSNMAVLLTLNSLVLGWRLIMRGMFTTHAHGWREGLFSLPRALVGNYINFRAAARALRRYIAIALRRERNIWEKTDHRFPTKMPG